MAQTKFQFEGFAPFTNDSRLSEFARAIAAVFDAHRVTGFFTTQTGPYPDGYREKDFTNVANSRNVRPVADGASGGAGDGQRSERARAAAEDFGDAPGEQVHTPEPEQGSDRRDGRASDAGSDGGAEPGRKPRKPRSDAGKPRGSRSGAEASGSAAGKRDDGGSGAQAGSARVRDGDGRPAERGGEGRRQGEGADGGAGRGVGRPGRADNRDAEAPTVSAADEDWDSRGDAPADPEDEGDGDDLFGEPEVDPADFRTGEDDGVNGEEWCAKSPGEWPESLTPEVVDRTTLSSIMSDHYKAHGGKFRAVTFDLLWKTCQADNIADVPEKDMRRVAKVFLKDTARYKFGLQAQPTKAPPK